MRTIISDTYELNDRNARRTIDNFEKWWNGLDDEDEWEIVEEIWNEFGEEEACAFMDEFGWNTKTIGI